MKIQKLAIFSVLLFLSPVLSAEWEENFTAMTFNTCFVTDHRPDNRDGYCQTDPFYSWGTSGGRMDKALTLLANNNYPDLVAFQELSADGGCNEFNSPIYFESLGVNSCEVAEIFLQQLISQHPEYGYCLSRIDQSDDFHRTRTIVFDKSKFSLVYCSPAIKTPEDSRYFNYAELVGKHGWKYVVYNFHPHAKDENAQAEYHNYVRNSATYTYKGSSIHYKGMNAYMQEGYHVIALGDMNADIRLLTNIVPNNEGNSDNAGDIVVLGFVDGEEGELFDVFLKGGHPDLELFTKTLNDNVASVSNKTRPESGKVIDYVMWRSSNSDTTSLVQTPGTYNFVSRSGSNAPDVSDHRPVEASFKVTHQYSITHDVLPVIITSILL